MESVDDEGAVDAAALPLAQAKTGVEHVVLQQDALSHPENLHHGGEVDGPRPPLLSRAVLQPRI